jgi:diguanylate cyclase (GGDEF)-like protein
MCDDAGSDEQLTTMSSRALEHRLHRYTTPVTVVGWVALAVLLATARGHLIDPDDPAFWVFAGFVTFGEMRPIRVVGNAGELAVSTTFILALMLSYGTATAVLVQAVASLVADVAMRKPLRRGLFNVGQYTISWIPAGLVIALLVGRAPGTAYSAPELPGILLGASVFFALNSLLARSAVALSQGEQVLPYVRKDLAFRAWTTAMLAGLAPAVTTVSHVDLALVPLIVLPMAAIHRAAREAARNEHLAKHDGLTGLANRILFMDRAEQALVLARRRGDAVAVIIMDLDRFKEINDTLGHHHGDVLLREVGARLEGAVRESDTVARLGGDEFAVLLCGVAAPPESGVAIAETLLVALREPFVVDGLALDVSASLGISWYPDDAGDIDTLMQHADIAMYRAKANGGGYELYIADHDHHTVRRLAMATELRRAIADEALTVHYQPKVDVRTGLVTGVEALARWERPGLGMVSPDEFIPLAEHTGLIHPLTTLVLSTSLRQARAWETQGLDLSVAVNLSARSLADRLLPGHVAELLEAEGADPTRLELEITESMIMADPTRAMSVLRRLNAMGVRLAIDDFGTGYSSLAQLKRLRAHTIKIDRSFVMQMSSDPSDAVIVRSIVELARNLGLTSVAEGVEDEQTLRALRGIGCDQAQGYHYSRPRPAEQLTPWLLAHGCVAGALPEAQSA